MIHALLQGFGIPQTMIIYWLVMTMAKKKRMTFFRMILPKPLRDLMRLLEILTKYINGGIRTTKKKMLQPPPSIFLMKSPQSLNPFLHFLAELGTNSHVSLTLRQTKSLCLVCHWCTFLRLSPLPAPDLPQQKNRKPSKPTPVIVSGWS